MRGDFSSAFGLCKCSDTQISHFSHGVAQFDVDVTSMSDCHLFGSALPNPVRVGVFDGDQVDSRDADKWGGRGRGWGGERVTKGGAEEPEGGV